MEFKPYSKEQQLRGHQKQKDKPKFKERRPKKRKKKVETFKGRSIPSAKVRGAITKMEYERAIEVYGASCIICGDPRIEMHHVVYRSLGGRGGYRNLYPLCNFHHMRVHESREFTDLLIERKKQRYGEHFSKDRFDLFKANVIPNSTKESFEKFMKEQEHAARCLHESPVD